MNVYKKIGASLMCLVGGGGGSWAWILCRWSLDLQFISSTSSGYVTHFRVLPWKHQLFGRDRIWNAVIFQPYCQELSRSLQVFCVYTVQFFELHLAHPECLLPHHWLKVKPFCKMQKVWIIPEYKNIAKLIIIYFYGGSIKSNFVHKSCGLALEACKLL